MSVNQIDSDGMHSLYMMTPSSSEDGEKFQSIDDEIAVLRLIKKYRIDLSPGVAPSFGISPGVASEPPPHGIRHQDAAKLNQGSHTEREYIAGDAKEKCASGENREAESTDALDRSGLPSSSDEPKNGG